MVEDIANALVGTRKRDLIAWLESDPRVRDWLGNGALLGTKEAAEYVGVERVRMWRWEQTGKITPVVKLSATPLFLKADLNVLKRERAAKAKAEAKATA